MSPMSIEHYLVKLCLSLCIYVCFLKTCWFFGQDTKTSVAPRQSKYGSFASEDPQGYKS